MKKTIIFVFLLAFSMSYAQETIPAVAEGMEVLVKDVPLDEFDQTLDSLQRLLDKVNKLSDIPGNAQELINIYPAIKDGAVTFYKQVRKPESKDDVQFMVKLLSDYAEVVWPFLVYFITFLYRMVRKSPEAALTALGKVTQFMKTRYFVVAISVVLTIVWGLFFREGDFSAWNFVTFLFGTVLKGVGIANIVEWIRNLFFKKDNVPA